MDYKKLTETHKLYDQHYKQWKYLLDSYMGGHMYRSGMYLTRYANETNSEYQERLDSTPLDNHCKGVIQTYNSFLFAKEPERDFAQLEADPALEAFLDDADLEGRSFDVFMKDVSTYSSIFGHTWIIMTKPNVGALTKADEMFQQVRPYVSQISPLNVIDWQFVRQPNGYHSLEYLKYYEACDCDCSKTIVEWTSEFIRTYTIDTKTEAVTNMVEEVNGLGRVAAVIVYAQRGPHRAIGISDIEDIADIQKAIYNENSEIEQGIRLSSHPSLVKTVDVEASAGAGAIIQMPDTLDPGLKPYLLENSGSNLTQIFEAQKMKIDAIDRIAHTSSVRAIAERTMSGIAMQTEFRQLEARIAQKADNLAWSEENIWDLFAQYQGTTWEGEVNYSDTFSIQDKASDLDMLVKVHQNITDPTLLTGIEHEMVELVTEEDVAELAREVLTITFPGLPAAAQEEFEPTAMKDPITEEVKWVEDLKTQQDLFAKGWEIIEDN